MEGLETGGTIILNRDDKFFGSKKSQLIQIKNRYFWLSQKSRRTN